MFYLQSTCRKSCRGKFIPYEVIRGGSPSLAHLRKVGSTAFVHRPAQKRNSQFESRSEKRVLVGYNRGDSYRMVLESNVIIEIKRTIFDD